MRKGIKPNRVAIWDKVWVYREVNGEMALPILVLYDKRTIKECIDDFIEFYFERRKELAKEYTYKVCNITMNTGARYNYKGRKI